MILKNNSDSAGLQEALQGFQEQQEEGEVGYVQRTPPFFGLEQHTRGPY